MGEAMRDVVVISGVRTAIGDFGGSLKNFSPSELGTMIVRETLQRANIAGAKWNTSCSATWCIPSRRTCISRASRRSMVASRNTYQR